jgi:gliding motility-associated-like protein
VFFLYLTASAVDKKELEKTMLLTDAIECIQVIGDDSAHINLASPFSGEMFFSNSITGTFNQFFNPGTTNGGLTILIGNMITQSNILWFYMNDPILNSQSDTLSNIVLDVDAMNGGGIANLSWNQPYTSAFNPPSNSVYIVQREYPVGVWTEIAQLTIGTNSYLDTITICNDFINYRIDWEWGSSCRFISNVKGDIFNNNTPPDIPEIIQVSVDTAEGFASLLWQSPPQQDVQGYVIVQNIGGFSVAIDTIWDPSINYYVDYSTDVNNMNYSYGIAAFDTCINPNSNPPFFYISPPTALIDFHKTILLQNNYLACDQINELVWNKYINWPESVLKYELYVSQNGAPFQLLQSLGPNDTTYTHENLDAFSNYCYLIKALDESETRYSLSNIFCQTIEYPGLPDILYLASTRVDSAENVSLSFYVESEEDIEIEGFTVQALYPNEDTYIDIGYIPYIDQSNFEYLDENTNAEDGSIYYRIQILDGCGNANFYSNQINTIFVSVVTDNDNAINSLVWNKAEGRAGEIISYTIFRSHNDEPEVIIYEAGPNEYFIQDDLSEEWEKEGDYCYFVEPNEENNSIGVFLNSKSNEGCTQIEPRIWIPNAFNILGSTPTFMPVFAYADVENYRMTIINRWGKTLFVSTDVFLGWDGYYEGNPVPQGVYIYVIELKDGLGKLITKGGSVTVFSNR